MATPIEFPEQNTVYAGDPASGVKDLPCLLFETGVVLSCWALSPAEIAQIKIDGHIWLMQQVGARPLQPQLVVAGNPFEEDEAHVA